MGVPVAEDVARLPVEVNQRFLSCAKVLILFQKNNIIGGEIFILRDKRGASRED